MNTRIKSLGLAMLLAAVAACGTTPNVGDSEDRAALGDLSRATLKTFVDADPTLQGVLDRSKGYAIFPRIVSAAIGVGGAHGNGEVYQNGRLVGFADLSQASIGAQLGGQKYAELIVFTTEAALLNFQQSDFTFDARATAVAAANGAAAAADYSKGVAIFTQTESGLMAQAAVGGQKFRYQPK